MSPLLEKEIKLDIALPITGYRRIMFFNRFSVQPIGNHRLVYFGLMDDGFVLRDVYACLITSEALERQREGVLAFLEKIGQAKTQSAPWIPPQTLMQTDCASFVQLGNAGLAEVLLSNFAVTPFISPSKGPSKPTLEAQGIALLQCELEMIRLLIAGLYVD